MTSRVGASFKTWWKRFGLYLALAVLAFFAGVIGSAVTTFGVGTGAFWATAAQPVATVSAGALAIGAATIAFLGVRYAQNVATSTAKAQLRHQAVAQLRQQRQHEDQIAVQREQWRSAQNSTSALKYRDEVREVYMAVLHKNDQLSHIALDIWDARCARDDEKVDVLKARYLELFDDEFLSLSQCALVETPEVKAALDELRSANISLGELVPSEVKTARRQQFDDVGVAERAGVVRRLMREHLDSLLPAGVGARFADQARELREETEIMDSAIERNREVIADNLSNVLHREPSTDGDTVSTAHPASRFRDVLAGSEKLLEVEPRAAVISAWIEVERAIQDRYETVSHKAPSRRSAIVLLHDLYRRDGGLSKQLMKTIQDLSNLRNALIHERGASVTADAAMDYLYTANSVIEHLADMPVFPISE